MPFTTNFGANPFRAALQRIGITGRIMEMAARFVMPILAASIASSCSAVVEPAPSGVARRVGAPMVEEVMEILAARDFARLAAWTSDQGLLLSPYLFIAPTSLRLGREEIARCAIDPRIREWGIWDGRGDPIRMTCADYFDRLVWVADFRAIEPTVFDTPLAGALEPDNHRALFPDALIVWRRQEEHRDREGRLHPWQSLHLVFARERGRWRLVAIARGTRVI